MLTVVGVTADVRQQLDRAPHDEVYLPLFQVAVPQHDVDDPFDACRSTRSRRPSRPRASQHDPELPVSNFRTLAEVRSSRPGVTARDDVVDWHVRICWRW